MSQPGRSERSFYQEFISLRSYAAGAPHTALAFIMPSFSYVQAALYIKIIPFGWSSMEKASSQQPITTTLPSRSNLCHSEDGN
jgi:hypothetical protein